MLCIRHCCCYYTIPSFVYSLVVAQIRFIHTFDASAICHWLQVRRDQDVTQNAWTRQSKVYASWLLLQSNYGAARMGLRCDLWYQCNWNVILHLVPCYPKFNYDSSNESSMWFLIQVHAISCTCKCIKCIHGLKVIWIQPQTLALLITNKYRHPAFGMGSIRLCFKFSTE